MKITKGEHYPVMFSDEVVRAEVLSIAKRKSDILVTWTKTGWESPMVDSAEYFKDRVERAAKENEEILSGEEVNEVEV